MYNILFYARHNLKTFDELPFNEADSLVLSCLAYLHFPPEKPEITTWAGLRIREIFYAELFEGMLREVPMRNECLKLLTAVSCSPRFRDIRLCGHVHVLNAETSEQFAAVTCRLPHGLNYAAFRGTDPTFIGWKEDMNLGRENPVASQTAAADYLEKAMRHVRGDFLVGGHSKGGNLAVFAAAHCSDACAERIRAVYSHDGPGFTAAELAEEGFRRLEGRLHKTIPQSSLVGMIFEQECEYRVVTSSAKGIAQHNAFTWQLEDLDFVCRQALTPESRLAYKSINDWAKTLSEEEREKFTNAVFDILEETEADSFEELGTDWQKHVPVILKRLAAMDKETKNFLLQLFHELAEIGVKNIPAALKGEKKEKRLTEAEGSD